MKIFFSLAGAITLAGLLFTGCAQPALKYKPLGEMMEDAVADSAWPGGVLMIGQGDRIVFFKAVGFHTYEKKLITREDDIFDMASVSKVIGTTSAVMKLLEAGRLSLDDAAVDYLPELKGPTPVQTALKKTVTVRHLLTHTAGFEPFRLFYEMEGSEATRWDSVFQSELQTKPGDNTVYSDIGMMVMGKIVERITGMPLDAYIKKEIFTPLGMGDSGYNPPAFLLPRIVPTEIINGQLVHGYVHDENTHSLGGVAGHAGLFSTASDLSRFCRMMLKGGELDGVRIFKPETIEQFTTPVSPGSSRCLGWDSPDGESSGGIYIPSSAFGHTGFTGTSLWIDPENDVYVILLTNAVHPHRAGKIPKYFDWRQLLHSAAYEELGLTRKNPDLHLKQRWMDKFGIKG